MAAVESSVIEKGYRRGTHRLVAPETTWSVIEPLLASFGITRVADITGLDDVGIPVFIAVRPASATLAVSAGKGVTPLLARVSATMEMIEFAHAEAIGPAVAHGSWGELHDRSFGLRELALVPGSLVGESVLLEWVLGRGLLSGRQTLVPREYVQMSNVVKRCWAPPLFDTSTNGLASGNSVSEATLHGLYELIERDCLAELAERDPADHVRVDPDGIEDPDCRWLIERLRAADNWFEIIDATGRIGVPCYVVNVWSAAFPIMISGSGCHLCPAVAASRALTEAAQSRLSIISGTRESIPEQVYLLSHVRQARPRPLDEDARVVGGLRADTATDSLDHDLARVARRVRETIGREPIVVDLSGGCEGYAVTKTIVPGLRFDPAHGTTQRVRQG